MKAAQAQFGSTHSHGDLHSLEIIEDKSGNRRKHGLPARYQKGRFLGKGGFAKCYEVQDMETKEIFAAKIVSKASVAKPRAHAKLRSEIAIHRSLDHEMVVKFYDYFEDSEYVYILLEVCSNQTLNEFMRRRPAKRFSEQEAMFYIYDLIMALKYLHRRRVIHRDLKLGNLFLSDDMRLKVGDFGLAAQLEHDGEKKRTICGTPNYIAPEILEGKHGHSFEVDVWSLGVILYTMIIGRPPFETSDVKTTYKRIRMNQFSFPDTSRISSQAKDLITSILRTDPRQRPSLDEILASPWFQGTKLPPPIPASVSSCCTPRVPESCASARSETPERGAADFARIDSPMTRFPLRDCSPSPAQGLNTPTPTHGQLVRGMSAGSLKASTPLVSTYANMPTTPGRLQQTGRPPLAHRGNEENVIPNYTNTMDGKDAASCAPPPLSSRHSPEPWHAPRANVFRTPSQQLVGTGSATCRPQSAHSNLGSNSLSRPLIASPQVNRGKDVSPLQTVGSMGALPSARISGYQTARRQPSTSRHERSCSSPALFGLDATPRSSAHHDGPTSSRKADAGLDSCPRLAYTANGAHSSRSEVNAFFGAGSSSSRQCPSPRQARQQGDAMPELWVTKWVDYSSKYGVGYILSDGSIGVYFNDSTKIIMVPNGSQFDYVMRRTQDRPEVRATHTFEDYPEDLKKKVTLLRHFKNYMLTDVLEQKDGATGGESGLRCSQPRPQVSHEPGQGPFVKKWTRNRHAIMFQLSNKIVQVVFFDKTEAVLSSKTHTVTYVDKRGQVSSYPLSNVLDVPNPELAKRLRYTKDILVNLLGTRAPLDGPGGSASVPAGHEHQHC